MLVFTTFSSLIVFIGAFLFLKQERGGLSASIFSKKKRIYAAIPNANHSEQFDFEPIDNLSGYDKSEILKQIEISVF